MVSFIAYDLTFMVVFIVVAFLLLYRNKQNVKRQGWIFLYHSKFGLKTIDWIADRFKRILKPAQYLVIACGYVLMAVIVWMLGLSIWRYLTSAVPEQLQNVPPIAPLIPYFPKLFGLESFFPPLYFTYFLIALAIVAVSHEFAHGIFARLNGIRVKTTGLAFFGPFFGAFVEPDEKQMAKQGNFPQLSVLAAGTFANVVMTILFLVILAFFFALSFTPAGVVFNAYPQAVIQVDSITEINGVPVDGLSTEGLLEEEFNEIVVSGETYLTPDDVLITASETGAKEVVVFDDAPAVRERLRGPILAIDGVTVTSQYELAEELRKNSPGDVIELTTLEDGERIVKEIELGANEFGQPYLGVGFLTGNRGTVSTVLFGIVQSIKDPLVYYEPAWDGDFVVFIYDLLWWIVVINILVALFNMLPVSILDGGRFFYLTIAWLSGSKEFGNKAYKFATWIIVLGLIAMVFRWIFVFF